jgi:hypothetical protein
VEVNMKERPVIFNGEMVRSILEGRKKQARYIVTPQPINSKVGMVNACYCGHPELWLVDGDVGSYTCNGLIAPEWLCPFGVIGDRLWVRETFAIGLCTESTLAYKATHKPDDLEEGWFEKIEWKRSSHMPRWASRINLEITGVRVERLKDITEEDASYEGMSFTDYRLDRFNQQRAGWLWKKSSKYEECLQSARSAFGNLWESIHSEESWNANPLVWVLEFKRL